jgi:hypothetical protein
MPRTVLTVGPAVGKGWEVTNDGQGSPQRFDRKEEAVKWARQRARSVAPSQLRVKGANGRIQTEYTYGSDPRDTKG